MWNIYGRIGGGERLQFLGQDLGAAVDESLQRDHI